MSQDLTEITHLINHLSQRDFVRLKLYINEKFEKMKLENPKKINNIVYAVKNPEKVKDSVNKYRRNVRNSNSNAPKKEKSIEESTSQIDSNSIISTNSN